VIKNWNKKSGLGVTDQQRKIGWKFSAEAFAFPASVVR
jgi:hypothetical protein